MQTKLFLFLLGITLFFAACSKTTEDSHNYLKQSLTADEIRNTSNKLMRISNMFIGHFSNAEFVKNVQPAGLVPQEVIGVRIWPERTDGIWLYSGWFKPDFPEEALSQGVFKLQRISPDTISLVHYKLPEREDKYSYEWTKKKPFADLKPQDLIFKNGCDQKIVAIGEEEYQVLHNPDLCPVEADGGIVYMKLDIRISPEYLDFHSSFHDAKKELVVDYSKGNKFTRLDKNQPKYSKTDK